MLRKLFRCWKCLFRADKGQNKSTESFYKIKTDTTSVEFAESSGCISTHETNEKVDLVKELVLQKRTVTKHWSCQFIENFMCVNSEHSEREPERGSDCRQICVSLAGWWVEFLAKKKMLSFHTLPTQWIQCRVISFFSRNLNCFKGNI